MNTQACTLWHSPAHTGQLLWVLGAGTGSIDYERWACTSGGLWRVTRMFALDESLFTKPATSEEEKRFIEERNLYNQRGRGIVRKKS